MRKKVKLKPDDSKGLRCPRCNCADMRSESGWNVRMGRRRKRLCRNCGHHIYTTESPEEPGSEEPKSAESG